MVIDCGRCTIRGVACESCAVTSIAGAVTFVTEAAPARAPAPARPPSAASSAPTTAAANRRLTPRPAGAPVLPPKSRGTTTTTSNPTSAGNRARVIELDAAETRALAALANAGLIPPLRYAPSIAKAC
jgi:hypothetical protein